MKDRELLVGNTIKQTNWQPLYAAYVAIKNSTQNFPHIVSMEVFKEIAKELMEDVVYNDNCVDSRYESLVAYRYHDSYDQIGFGFRVEVKGGYTWINGKDN